MDFLPKKKSFKTILIIVFASIIITNNILGQSSNMWFSKFSKEQGLSNILINTISQDKQGFLWIGTWDGLNRFDGYQFKVYKPMESDKLTLNADTEKILSAYARIHKVVFTYLTLIIFFIVGIWIGRKYINTS